MKFLLKSNFLLILVLMFLTNSIVFGAATTEQPLDLSNRDQVLAAVSKAKALMDKACDDLKPILKENPLWYIEGKIIPGTDKTLLLWGSAGPRPFDSEEVLLPIGNIWFQVENEPASNHQGWQKEGNIKILNPNPEKIDNENEYFKDGPYWYIRQDIGYNVLGSKVPVKVYGPAPAIVTAKLKEAEAIQNKYMKLGKNIVNSLLERGQKFETEGKTDQAVAVYSLTAEVIFKYEYEVPDYIENGRNLIASLLKISQKYQSGNAFGNADTVNDSVLAVLKHFASYNQEFSEQNQELLASLLTQAEKYETAGETGKADSQYSKAIDIISNNKSSLEGFVPSGLKLAQNLAAQGNKYLESGNRTETTQKFDLFKKDIVCFNDYLDQFAGVGQELIASLTVKAIQFEDAGKTEEALATYKILTEIFDEYKTLTFGDPGYKGKDLNTAREFYIRKIGFTRRLSDLYLKMGDNSQGLQVLSDFLSNAQKIFVERPNNPVWSRKTETGLFTLTGYPEGQTKNNNFFQLGLLHIQARQTNQAYLDFKNALQVAKITQSNYPALYSESAFTHYLLGIAYYFTDPDQGAMVSELNKAIELDGKNAEYYNTLGFLYLGKNNFQPAIENFQKAIELNPEYKLAYGNLSFTLKLTGGSASDSKKYFDLSGGKIGTEWGQYKIKKETNTLVEYLDSLDKK